MRRIGLWVGLTFVFLLWGHGRGRAAQPATVVVASQTCDASFEGAEAWIALLRVELADDGIDVQRAERDTVIDPSAAQARLETNPCDKRAQSATLTFSLGQSERTRTLNLEDIADVAEARVVAIAMASLIRSSLAEERAHASAPTPQNAPKPAEVRVTVEAEKPSEEHHAPRAWRPLMAGEARFFSEAQSVLFGARLGLFSNPAKHVFWTLDAGILVGKDGDELGEVRSILTTLGAGLLAGGGKTVRLGAGPRIEGGLGRFRGLPDEQRATGTSVSSALLFAGLSGAMSFRIAGPCSAHVAVDAGTTVYGFYARAGVRHVSDLRGPMLSLRVGLMF